MPQCVPCSYDYFVYVYTSNGCFVLDAGTSQLQFGVLELSQSQDLESDVTSDEDVRNQLHSGAAVFSSSRTVKNDIKDGM